MTIHEEPLYSSTIQNAFELLMWNTVDNKTYRFTVGNLLTRDALETTGNGNVRSRGQSNSATGSFNLMVGNGNVQSGAGAYNLMVGDGNTLTGSSSLVVGKDNTLIGDNHFMAGEVNLCSADALYGQAMGYGNKFIGSMNTVRGQGALAFRFGEFASASMKFSEYGDNQLSILHGQVVTGAAAALEEILLAGDDITLATDQSLAFEAHIHAVLHSGSPGTVGDSVYKIVRGLVKNVGGTVTLTGSTTTSSVATDTELDYAFTVAADDTNKKLKITFTPQAGQVVRAAAHLLISQIGFDSYTG